MVRDGHRRILVLATSAYASYSGCRQYRENLADALAALEAEGLELRGSTGCGTTSTTRASSSP